MNHLSKGKIHNTQMMGFLYQLSLCCQIIFSSGTTIPVMSDYIRLFWLVSLWCIKELDSFFAIPSLISRFTRLEKLYNFSNHLFPPFIVSWSLCYLLPCCNRIFSTPRCVCSTLSVSNFSINVNVFVHVPQVSVCLYVSFANNLSSLWIFSYCGVYNLVPVEGEIDAYVCIYHNL